MHCTAPHSVDKRSSISLISLILVTCAVMQNLTCCVPSAVKLGPRYFRPLPKSLGTFRFYVFKSYLVKMNILSILHFCTRPLSRCGPYLELESFCGSTRQVCAMQLVQAVPCIHSNTLEYFLLFIFHTQQVDDTTP